MSRDMRLLHVRCISLRSEKEGNHTCNEEEDAVHYSEGKAGLQHSALLIRREVQSIYARRAENAETDLVAVAGCDGDAVLA